MLYYIFLFLISCVIGLSLGNWVMGLRPSVLDIYIIIFCLVVISGVYVFFKSAGGEAVRGEKKVKHYAYAIYCYGDEYSRD